MMLFTGCSACRAILPLWCAGQFMPHAPLPMGASPMGPYCGFCGILPPVFVCTVCWTRQALYLPGAQFAPPVGVPGLSQYVAPVIQAPQGTSQNQLSGLFQNVASQFLKEFAGGFGNQLGQNAASGMSNWMSGY